MKKRKKLILLLAFSVLMFVIFSVSSFATYKGYPSIATGSNGYNYNNTANFHKYGNGYDGYRTLHIYAFDYSNGDFTVTEYPIKDYQGIYDLGNGEYVLRGSSGDIPLTSGSGYCYSFTGAVLMQSNGYFEKGKGKTGNIVLPDDLIVNDCNINFSDSSLSWADSYIFFCRQYPFDFSYNPDDFLSNVTDTPTVFPFSFVGASAFSNGKWELIQYMSTDMIRRLSLDDNGFWRLYYEVGGTEEYITLEIPNLVYTFNKADIMPDGTVKNGMTKDIDFSALEVGANGLVEVDGSAKVGLYLFFGTKPPYDFVNSVSDSAVSIFDVANTIASVIVNTPLLLLFAVGLPVISFGVGVIIRIKSRA